MNSDALLKGRDKSEGNGVAQKRVCIIGAGVSGLPAIKCCLDEGLLPVCYERTDDMGGLWNYQPQRHKENQSTVMESTVVNTSKEMMAYSDYPPPDHYPNFMHNRLVNQYLHDYATTFGLDRYIQFNTNVEEVKQAVDYEQTGAWTVSTNKGHVEHFDAVMMCHGHHSHPFMPDINNMHKFKGEVIHSQAYHEPSPYEGKRVLIIGIGNSGLDAAVDLTRVAQKVYLSTRRGAWIWNRVSKRGLPFDILFQTRMYKWQQNILPISLTNDFLENQMNRRFDHAMYGLRPRHRFLSQHPSVNDPLPNLILSGKITIKDDVKDFTESNVTFVDDSEADIDVVILSTGYVIDWPFLKPNGLIPIQNNAVSMYKFVFPTNLSHHTLSVIGLIQPYGAVQPISEMQSRWVCRVLTGRCQLPSNQSMIDDVTNKRLAMSKRYTQSHRHTVQVDYLPYMDELAALVGCSVPVWASLFKDPVLFLSLAFGPNVPYVYRLQGPHQWAKAKAVIQDTRRRVTCPLQTRPVCREKSYKSGGMCSWLRTVGWGLLWTVLSACLVTGSYLALTILFQHHSLWLYVIFVIVFGFVMFNALNLLNYRYDFTSVF